MAILLFDENNIVNIPTLILESKGGKRYGSITNFTDLVYKNQLNAANKISFTVYKYIDRKINYLWNDISDLKTIYIPEYNEKFQITVSYCDESSETKSVSGIALCEAELGQIYLRNFECNTDNDLEIHNYNVTKFYDPRNTNLSLLHRILHDKASHFKIGNVSKTLENLSYEFSVDEKSIYDFLTEDVAEQMHCIFEFDSMTRTINVYDLYSTCNNCKEEIIGKDESEYPKYRDDFHDVCPKCGSVDIIEGYGTDTTILIDKENLSTSICKDADIDSLKNCIYVEGGDDNINAAFILANPNGSQYVYYFSPELLSEMPEEFVNAYTSYNELYNKYYYGSNETVVDTKKTTHIINAEGNMSLITFDTNNPDSNYVTNFNNIIDEITSISNDIPYSNFLSYTSEYTFKNQSNLVTAYFNAIDFESFIQTKMMPTYEMEVYNKYHALSLLTSSNIGTIGIPNFGDYTVKTVVENAILQAVKSIINTALFNVDIYTSNYTSGSNIWKGTFVITDLLNNDDTTNSITNVNYQDIATKEGYMVTDTIYSSISLTINDDFISYAENRINYILAKKDLPTAIDLYKPNLSYEDFVSKIKYHSSDNLTLFYNVLTSCRDVLQEVKENITDTANAVYQKIIEYDTNYCRKMEAINDLIAKRENQIKIVHNYGSLIYAYITDIQKILNFQSFLENYAIEHKLTTNLWDIFNYYRRETTYKNENIISDSLETNSDLLKYAGYLMDFAKKEALKVGTPQLTISTTLNNLLAIPEFEPIIKDFNVGNWIRIKTDIQGDNNEDFIYKLRLLSYTIKYDSLEQIDVEFSTVFQTWSGLRDVTEIIKSAQSTATSITSISQQIDKNSETYNVVKDWVNNGLDLTNQMIMSDANNQSLIIDEHGLLARKYYDLTDTYDDCQLKIFNNGLYTTHDGWKTIDAGVGKFIWRNPENNWQEEETYGIIAKKIVGEQILGEDLKIISSNGSVSITGDGIVIKNGTISWSGINSPEISDINGLSQSLTTITGSIKQIDGRIQTYSQEKDPKTEESTKWADDDNEKHIGDVWLNTETGIVKVYSKEGNIYSWVETQDSNLKELAQSKAQIFTSKNALIAEGYQKGDLWIVGEGEKAGCNKGTILVANNSASPNGFQEDHWEETTVKDASNAVTRLEEVEKFNEKVNKALQLNLTEIGKDYVISPYIGGGYLSIKHPDDKRSVTIDPQQELSNNGYIFQVTNKDGIITIGADSNGNACFNGELSGATGTFSGNLSSSKIYLNSNSDENRGCIILNNLTEDDNIVYKEITLINDYASDTDNLAISFGFKNPETSKYYATTGMATVKKAGSIFNKMYSNTYFDTNAYFSKRIYFGNNFYLTSQPEGGVQCSGKFNTLGAVSIGNIDPGSNMLYVNGSAYINGNLNVTGNGIIKSLNDSNGISHSISLGWSGTDLQVLVDSTYFHLSTSTHNHDSNYASLYHTHRTLETTNSTVGITGEDNFVPIFNGNMKCGTEVHPWKAVYAENTSVQKSDARYKDIVCEIKDDVRYEVLFNNLKPKLYRFKNFTDKDKHDRIHSGYIAQEVKQAMDIAGIENTEFAAFCYTNFETDEIDTIDGLSEQECRDSIIKSNHGFKDKYMLGYSEFIALNTYMIQKNISKIDSLEKELKELKQKLVAL